LKRKKKNYSGWVPPLPFSTPPDGAAASPRVLLSEFHFAVSFFFEFPKASFIILFPLL
jgi:hypothetical protein